MSDTSQGEGWWLASNEKWYPPELHPTAVAARKEAAAAAAQQAGQAGPAGRAAGPAGRPAPQQGPGPEYRYQQAAWGQTAAGTGDVPSLGGHVSRTAVYARRRAVVAAVAVVVLAGVGLGIYFLTQPSSPSGGIAASGPGAAMGQSVTISVDGTTVTMTISRLLNPAPGAQPVGAQANQSFSGTPVAFLVTLANSGSTAYALRNLAFGVSQGSTSSGGSGVTSAAGVAFRQSGTLAAGATDSGWVTSVATAGAGPVTSINVAFNAVSARSPASTIARSWHVS